MTGQRCYFDTHAGRRTFNSVAAAKRAAMAYVKDTGVGVKVFPLDVYGRSGQQVYAKKNPAMLGGSILSRGMHAQHYAGDVYKTVATLVSKAKVKGNKRLSSRPRRSVEHKSVASNANSVLRTVVFKQPSGGKSAGKTETVDGLTAKEANKLADQLRNFGMIGVSVI